jgi:hypothetical protein
MIELAAKQRLFPSLPHGLVQGRKVNSQLVPPSFHGQLQVEDYAYG